MHYRTFIYGVLSRVARPFNMRVYNPEYTWWYDHDFEQAWRGFHGNRRNITKDRYYNLFNLAKLVKDVPGDIAECGVMQGHGSFLMLRAHYPVGFDQEKASKHLHGFDSFEGLSEPGKEDQSGHGWSKHDLATPSSVPYNNLWGCFPDRFTLYPGWIPTRFKDVADKTFSMVHIDVDLADPTRESLEFFWPRLNSGGIVVCDDYGSARCPGAKKVMDGFAASVGKLVVRLSTGQAFIQK
jgi:hypothetical protein